MIKNDMHMLFAYDIQINYITAMPPKKEEEPAVPIITWNILALTPSSSSAIEALNKPVNLKHLVNTQKMI